MQYLSQKPKYCNISSFCFQYHTALVFTHFARSLTLFLQYSSAGGGRISLIHWKSGQLLNTCCQASSACFWEDQLKWLPLCFDWAARKFETARSRTKAVASNCNGPETDPCGTAWLGMGEEHVCVCVECVCVCVCVCVCDCTHKSIGSLNQQHIYATDSCSSQDTETIFPASEIQNWTHTHTHKHTHTHTHTQNVMHGAEFAESQSHMAFSSSVRL